MAENRNRTSYIKRAKKESVILRTLSELFNSVLMEEPSLQGISMTRAELSPGKGLCQIYFYSELGEPFFEANLDKLKLYKPSMRKSLAITLNSRYTADIVFSFDKKLEKILKLEELIDKSIKE